MKKLSIEIDTDTVVKKYNVEVISTGQTFKATHLINHRPVIELKKRTQVKLLTMLTGNNQKLDRKIFSTCLTPEERASTINSLMAFATSGNNQRIKIEGGLHVQTEA